MECCSLSSGDISRYSRHLILSDFGVPGQTALRDARVLIVGCGGLGCPSAQYLAAAGVGTLGFVDHDVVEINNLHRQVLHMEHRVGQLKASSIAQQCLQLNSSILCDVYPTLLTSDNALAVIQKYDVVLDCSDNVSTRYLLNDACVLSGKPLVSGSALRWEGQLSVYNYKVKNGPCYRCLHPQPPPVEAVSNCSDGGVLGVVPGIMGSLQAMEAIKVITGIGEPLSGRLLLYDAKSSRFRDVKIGDRRPHCVICGDEPSMNSLIDYVQFCGAGPHDKTSPISLLDEKQRMHVKEYKELLDKGENHLLIDVRPEVQVDIAKFKHGLNIFVDNIDASESVGTIKSHMKQLGTNKIVTICRRGNDSQIAVHKLQEMFRCENPQVTITDIIGGYDEWAKTIDDKFPLY